MINQVYTTVLSILNKDNRGYVSPMEFNTYAELSQMVIFEELFHKYAKSLAKQNARMYHSEFSDIPKHLREVFDVFVDEGDLTLDTLTGLHYQSEPDFYKAIKIELIPAGKTEYGERKEVEEVSKLEINKLLNNNLIAPTSEYPVYIGIDGKYKIFPFDSVSKGVITYIRKPKAPKWTYIAVGNGPLFNPSASDYQDFELPVQFFSDLVIKILSYCGIEIREADVIQVSQALEASGMNNEQL